MNLSPLPIQKFFDNNGIPLAGGKLFSYIAGTTTKLNTYTDSTGLTANTNPIILNFRGECRLWIDPLLVYKFVLAPPTATDPPGNPIWTVDNITAAPATIENSAVDTGSGNSVQLSIPALNSTPVIFTRIVWKSAIQNTGNVTISINGGLAKNLLWQNQASLDPGALQIGGMYEAIYDGTAWQLQGPTLAPQYMITVEEFVAGVSIADYSYLPGDVRRYGATGDGTTDDTAALQDAAAYAREAVGAVIYFEPAKTYKIWPAGSGSTLFDLDGAFGVTVEGNGALLSAGNVNSSAPAVFDLQTVNQVSILNLRFTQSYATLDPDNGAEFFVIRQDSHNIELDNCQMVNGRSGIIVRGVTTDGPRSDGIRANNCTFSNVYYPQNMQLSGDNYFARGIKTLNCGRSYFPWNCRNHDVEMISQQGGPFDDVLFKVFADPAFGYNKLENIRLKYWSDGKSSTGVNTTSGAIVSLDAQQNTVVSTPAFFNNIDIQVIFEAGATVTARKLFECRKFTSTGAVDTTARGHVFANIKLRGRISGCQNFNATPVIDIFGTTDGFAWTGDAALNISVEDLYASTSSAGQNILQLNGQPFVGNQSVTLKNVFTEGQINRNNWTEAKAFHALNVSSSNLVASSGYQSYTPVWSGSGGAATLGNGSIIGRYTRQGDRVTGFVQLVIGTTSVAGAGNMQFSLPVAAAAGEGDQLGSALLLDTGTQFYTAVSFISDAASVANIFANVAMVTGTAPFTIANGDTYRLAFDYICAP